jgi:hypothetical protein
MTRREEAAMKAHTILGFLVVTMLAATSAGATAGHLDGYVPSAAHAPGRFGSFWTTDLWIYQQGASTIHLWFNPAGQNNAGAESVVLTLTEPSTFFPDVVSTLFGTDGVGSIHYLADGPVTVTSRTWTTSEGGGGYGQTIPGTPVSQAATPATGQAGSLRMIADQIPGMRSNLGLVNISNVTVTVLVEMFESDGDAAPGNSSFEINLEPFGMTQINDLFQRLQQGTRRGLIVRASVVSEAGAILAYLSTVDNSTNDASYHDGFRFGY